MKENIIIWKKSFIKIVNDQKETEKHVSKFTKKSNDLSYLPIADLSFITLTYEIIWNIGRDNLLNKEPLKYTIIDKDKIDSEIRKKEIELRKKTEEEIENCYNKNINENYNWNDNDDDEGDWITPENFNQKLTEMKGI